MTIRGPFVALATGVGVVAATAALAQAPPGSARVDTEPLDLITPDRFAVDAVLEPVRQVTLVAPADGVVRSQDAPLGADARVGEQVAVLDRAEASARLKIAQAEVKEAEADVKAPPAGLGAAKAEARLEAAQARAELAQLALDRCTLRAPFAGRVMAAPVAAGQFVTRGTALAELADLSSLKALVPVRRGGAKVGGTVNLIVEGEPVPGRVQALVPLPESMAVVHEVASPFTAAWVVVSNADGALEPGRRATSPDLPSAPTAVIPAHALKPAEKGKAAPTAFGAPGVVQVIRNEYVTDVKVTVLGHPGSERTQVTGPLRATDSLIVSSSVPLLAGTLIRFNGGAGSSGETIEATAPSPSASGAPADLTAPRTAGRGAGPAPIGAPGSAAPRGRAPATRTPAAPAPAAKKAGSSVPF